MTRRGGAALFAAVVLFCLLTPLLSPHDPYRPDLARVLLPPSAEHWLGTDQAGRDLLTRTAAAGRASLLFALTVTAVTTVLGSAAGAVAGLARGRPDRLLGFAAMGALAVPGLTLALALTGVMGAGYGTLLAALVPLGWVSCALAVRTAVRQAAAADYVQATRSIGASGFYLLRRAIAPQVIGPALTVASGDTGRMLAAATSLSFLGVGPPPPDVDWGGMVNEAVPLLVAAPQLALAPALALTVTGLAIALMADALRGV
ncbi:ABC transporter permease [Microtetraspora sp. NBRC 13810]|uniref:ABC transporter permease n=1 Tax=Microtetraspora sp. NBRC 13810 TaxID=3030990 RepID=UPI0024A01A9F|nr:ABC transporter permease [Microtetraspora sp. NBRC 13810]GLW11753.1 ABC transporter permease [Microtetraspora sp. NBRC 13810]